MVGRKTEKTRLKRSMGKLREKMRSIRHYRLKDQAYEINQIVRGHYAYYGLGGNFKSLWKIYKFVEGYWHKMLCSRSRKSYVTWDKFLAIQECRNLLCCEASREQRGAGNPHATLCGGWNCK